MFGKKNKDNVTAVPEKTDNNNAAAVPVTVPAPAPVPASAKKADNNDPMAAIAKKLDKQLRLMRIMCVAVVAASVSLVLVCVMIVPRAFDTIDEVHYLMEDASEVMENANTTLEGINSMSSQITTAAEGINGLVETNADVLTDSMNKLNAIDFEGLNSAISDLQAVVEPMASFFGRFGR